LITADNITDLGVTTAKINDLAVTTGKINDAAVTQAKRAALGQQISASSGNYTTTSSSYVDVTNLSVTITTTGRPVFIALIPDGSSSSNYVGGVGTGTPVLGSARFRILRDATTVADYGFPLSSPDGWFYYSPVSAISVIEVPAAGPYTYKLQAWAQDSFGSVTSSVQYAKLIAFEL
jgi:hypothetical protein